MEGNFSEQLKTVLSDPEAMATIAGLAKNFAQKNAEKPGSTSSDSGQSGEAPKPSPGAFSDLMASPAIASVLRLLGDGSRERMALLVAMRPFVRDEKKEKLDRIIQTMKMLDLLVSAQKLL